MKSFTNKSGEIIEVSQDHLDTAIKIKEQLQKASPSRRCSWITHKKLMEKEGYFDSDNNESYRCMIKEYQKSLGLLPCVTKHADMIIDNKIESIKELVGEIAYEKREAQHEFRKLNKVKRDIIDFTLIAEQIGTAFKEYDWSDLEFDYHPIANSENKMIVCLSDLHIGALVDTDANKYDFEIAKKRMQEYLNRVVKEIKKNGVSLVYLINLGDSIEHPYMHNLMYNSEFTLSEQMAHASDIIIKFMVGLSQHVNVIVAGIAGNHDRFNENKNMSLDGDHAVKGINKAVHSFIENSNVERITYEQAKDYEHSFNVNGVNILAVHGDLDNKDDKNLIAKHSSLKGVDYDLILMGHYHTREIKELGEDKFLVVSGSLKGSDNYSLNKLRKVSSPSQTYIIVSSDKEIDIKWVTLK